MRDRAITSPLLPSVALDVEKRLAPVLGRFTARRAVDVAAARIGICTAALRWEDREPLMVEVHRIVRGLLGPQANELTLFAPIPTKHD